MTLELPEGMALNSGEALCYALWTMYEHRMASIAAGEYVWSRHDNGRIYFEEDLFVSNCRKVITVLKSLEGYE